MFTTTLTNVRKILSPVLISLLPNMMNAHRSYLSQISDVTLRFVYLHNGVMVADISVNFLTWLVLIIHSSQ